MLKNLKDFENDFKINKADRTVKNYVNNLNHFNKWLELNNKELSQNNAQEYINSKSNLSFDTLNLIRVSINAYLKFNKKERFELKIKSKTQKIITAVNEKDYTKLLNAVNKIEKEKDIEKYKILLMLGGVGGLRAREALNLKKSNIDFDDNFIHIKGAKRDKERRVPINDETMKEIKIYCNRNESDKLFNVSYETLDRHFRKYRKEIGKNDYTFHSLRHMCGTRIMKATGNAQVGAQILGNTIDIFLKNYCHSDDGYLKNVAEMLKI